MKFIEYVFSDPKTERLSIRRLIAYVAIILFSGSYLWFFFNNPEKEIPDSYNIIIAGIILSYFGKETVNLITKWKSPKS
jgi:hypothetical protein